MVVIQYDSMYFKHIVVTVDIRDYITHIFAALDIFPLYLEVHQPRQCDLTVSGQYNIIDQ